MSRTYTIEETITDSLTRGQLMKCLMREGLVPDHWDRGSVQVRQIDAGSEIEFVCKRSYPAQTAKDKTK